MGEALGDSFSSIETIRASASGDNITLDTTVDVRFGFGGNDTLTGSTDANQIVGGEGNDTIVGGGGNDVLNGDAGNDTITLSGTYTSGIASGGAGNDTINGGGFADSISGGGDMDFINGGAGADFMDGGDGNDFFTDTDGMSGDNYVGGAGYDRITYSNAGTYDFAGTGRDIISDTIENIIFSAQVTVQGGFRNETFTGSGFADTIDAGTGNDIVTGNAGADVLDGEVGNDKLYGGVGEDVVRGGKGSDYLTGGNVGVSSGDGAADMFYYEVADVDLLTDRITDFEIGTDKIALDSVSFGMTAGALDPSRFYATGDTVVGTQAVFIYNSATGLLTFDNNGATGGGQSSMVFLSGNPALSFSDFVVV